MGNVNFVKISDKNLGALMIEAGQSEMDVSELLNVILGARYHEGAVREFAKPPGPIGRQRMQAAFGVEYSKKTAKKAVKKAAKKKARR